MWLQGDDLHPVGQKKHAALPAHPLIRQGKGGLEIGCMEQTEVLDEGGIALVGDQDHRCLLYTSRCV